MLFNKKLLGIILLIIIFGITGCSQDMTNASKSPSNSLAPKAFLKKYELTVKNPPVKFNVNVPQNWDVQLGAYPEGLYWGLANEFSKDAGLDLTLLKGETIEAQVYELEGGLPGPGDTALFQYPSNVVLLVRGGKTVGAWLSFNVSSIGPSITKKSLQDLTGLTFEQWAARQGYFADAGKNSDLKDLSPTEVMDNFFAAINKGDKTRAAACLTPQALLESLTVNLEPGHLYNPGFGQNNSIVENIVGGSPVSYEFYDPKNHSDLVKEIGNRTQIGIAVKLKNLKWRDPAFNTPEENSIRFAILNKCPDGWRLDGLGTGP